MGDFFKRQMAIYIEYHRDPRNAFMHVCGILLLFTGAVLPLSLQKFYILGVPVTLGALLAVPCFVYWLLLDAALGIGILVAAVIPLSIAATIASHSDTATMWSIFGVLIVLGLAAQTIGHQVFEGREPSLFTFPNHLMLGPMFVMAKLYIAFGFRRDLAAIIGPVPANAVSTREG
ncbi:MAG: DUF962 domain-containing protein [Bradyrhizobium sp.]|uniref:Mpo1 family 2-hydroxy fatty acid dioxygenase n=1 Tax=Bradyrhizobium sp. TaxID=376 RepID=UPI0025BA53D4|nr:Mpo1-like protein [Bradyrhizobium sp.]MBI5264152.1 DUF962 domain-containing protein [Bradyrhizobium sp.]